MATGWLMRPASQTNAVAVTLQPVLRGCHTLPGFQNRSFANELYATSQAPALHRKDYFWHQISSFKSQDVSARTGADECVCFAYSQMQVEGEHTCLHPAGLYILRCVQTIAFLPFPPKKAGQTAWWMLGSGFLSLFIPSPSFTSKIAK